MTNTSRPITTFIALIALSGLTLTGCKNQVRVGVVLPLTGEHEIYGQASLKGLGLALAELQAAGNARFELTVLDSASDPEHAVVMLEQLYDNGAIVAVGGLTQASARKMAEVSERAERVLLSPSAALREQGEGSRYFFSLAAPLFTAGTTMATFAARDLGIGSAVLISDPELAASGSEEGFRTAFESQGGKLVAAITSIDDDPAISAASLEAVLAKNPDAVYLIGYEASASSVVRHLREQGYQGKILATEALANPASIERLGDAAHGVLLTHTPLRFDEGSAPAGSFAERYREMHGEVPGIVAAEGYDALMVLAMALAERPALPSEVRKGLLHDVKDFGGVTGSIQFNEARGVSKMPRVYSIAEDLSLRDHGKLLEAKKQRIAQERKKLLERLAALRGEATQASSG